MAGILRWMGYSDRAYRDKTAAREPIWRIVNAERTPGDKSHRLARICHVLQVEEAGKLGPGVIAGAQEGMIHRSQLYALGIGRRSIAHRVNTVSLHQVFPSVWAVGHAAVKPEGLEIAALLYAGHDAVLSHQTAAAAWGLTPRPDHVQVTVVGRSVRQTSGLRVHRVASFDARDVRIRHGIPVTAPARTMIDLIGCVEDDLEVERALAELRVQRLARDSELTAAMDRCPTRKGVARLRRLMADEQGPALTRSKAERLLRAICDQAQLPRPVSGARPCGFEVDFLWPDARLVVEVDGTAFHRHPQAFERDRRRDQVLVAAGYRVIRVTWRQLRDEPMAVMVRIGQALVVPVAGA